MLLDFPFFLQKLGHIINSNINIFQHACNNGFFSDKELV
ncbi:Uncharacterised protein [Mycobacteroides abscessus subsp. abscessus]|nr:Uncharacterised protein [Mycobacteroides abscessus subsp. abscessus]